MLDMQEYLPSSPLRKVIKGYYFIRYSFPAGSQWLQTAYATGDSMLSVALKEPVSLIDKEGNNLALPLMIAVGPFVQPVQTCMIGEGDSIWIRLFPNGFFKLFNTSIQFRTNPYHHIDFQQKFPKEALLLSANLNALPSVNDQVGYLNTFFEKRLKTNNSIDDAIDHILHIIAIEKGVVKSAALHKHVYLSERSFQRHFEKQVGILPKLYCRIVRFASCIQEITQNKNSLQEILYRYEYYDHSHFNKEIHFFTGKKPQHVKENSDWFFQAFFKEIGGFLQERATKTF